MSKGDFLTIAQAAEYLNVSAQTLRRWDQDGKLQPVRHPASKYRYYRKSDLEPFRLEYQTARLATNNLAEYFVLASANIDENPRLREPQREAHKAVRRHFAESSGPAILQIPVGCGKTGIISTLPFGVAAGRALVITPNITIRKGVTDALDIAHPECFWRKARVLTSIAEGPFTAVLDGPNANIHDCSESHFVVTNIQQLASSADRWLPQFPPRFFDMILVDEGHHNVAASWRKVFEKFPEAKVISLTATPFRSDGQALTGNIVYRYSYARAMINGYIKQIHSVNVAPSEIYFTYRGDTRRHTLEEVMQLREEAWFRRGVALSPECNKHIAEASIVRLMALRKKTGMQHQIIAAACSIDHARQVRSTYEQLGIDARELYSEMDLDKQERVLNELRDGRIGCIVQVQMLGEGFDHSRLSVAAVFRPFRSLSPYIQFVGRIMRVIHQDDPGHPDNQGYVVSHVGLNNDANWRDFQDVDFEDQEVIRKWLATATGSLAETIEEGGHPRRFDADMNVDNEIISHFIGQSYLNPDDDRVLDAIMAQRVSGTPFTVGDLKSREDLRAMLKRAQEKFDAKPEAIPVTPQRRRQTAKKRLSERANSVVARVLRDLNLSPAGFDLSRLRKGHGTNRSVLITLLNREVNKKLGINSGERSTITAQQAEEGLATLDKLADEIIGQLASQLRKEQSDAQGA